MESVVLTRVSVTDKDRDGKELVSKNGKKYWRVGIQTDKHGDKWLSGLCFEEDGEMLSWQEGDTATIMVEKRGEYLNFSVPTKKDVVDSRLNDLERRVKALEDFKQ